MINEALDYHMNMNHVVFNRERKHVETLGQQVLDATKSDIIIEGNIRDRISKIMTSIQKLVQGVQFTYEPEKKMGVATIDTTSPDEAASGPDKTTVAGSTARSKKYISDNIAAVLSDYNSLCDYLDLQNRQKPFSQMDIANIDGLVKQLIDPLKSAIGAATDLISTPTLPKPDEQKEYTRLYNVLAGIIGAINIGMPFQKVSASLLTERVPFKEGYKLPTGQLSEGNRKYFDNLTKSIVKQYGDSQRMPQGTPLEREAKKLVENTLAREMDKFRSFAPKQYVDNMMRGIDLLKPKTRGRPVRIYDETDLPIEPSEELARKRREQKEMGDRDEREIARRNAIAMGEDDIEETKGPVVESDTKGGEDVEARAINPKSLPTDEKKRILANEIIRGAKNAEFDYNGESYIIGTARGDYVVSDKMGFKTLKQLYNFLRKKSNALPPRKDLVGEGMDGGHVHKTNVFEDEQELEPYLTKHLKPSKYRRNVPPIESSSEESSGEEGSGSDMEIDEQRLGKGRKKKGTRRQRKETQDAKVIAKLPSKEAAVLIEKKYGGAFKTVVKPTIKPTIVRDSAEPKHWWM
jgi:hypothetical protein